MLRQSSRLLQLRSFNVASGKSTFSSGLDRLTKITSLGRCCCYSSFTRSSPLLSSGPATQRKEEDGLIISKLSPTMCISSQSISTTKRAYFLFKKNEEIPENDPEKGKLVYIGTLTNMVKLVKGFSVSTSLIGLCLQPFLYANVENQSIFLTIALGGTLSFFVFLTPLMLHYITKRYVTKLYYKSDTGVFTATSLTFFVHEKDTKFTQNDVTIPEIPGFFTTVNVKGKPTFVDPTLFRNREGYIKLMGYDKPIDWQMPSNEKKD